MKTYIALLFSDVYGVDIAVIGYLSLGDLGRLSRRRQYREPSDAAVRPAADRRLGERARLPDPGLGDRACSRRCRSCSLFAMGYHACMGARYTTQQTLLLAVTPAGKGATGGLNRATVQAGGVFASDRRRDDHRQPRLPLARTDPGAKRSARRAYLVWRAVSVDAGNAMEIEMESPAAADARSEQRPAKTAP